MTSVLCATDSDELFSEIDAALGSSEVEVIRVRSGRAVRPAVIESNPDVVILDLQIGSMGGFAASLDLRLEQSADRIGEQTILLLLDRDADEFLAKRSQADGWLVKPLSASRLERALTALLAGESFTEGPSVIEAQQAREAAEAEAESAA